MFTPYSVLHKQLANMVRDRSEQGRDVSLVETELEDLPDDYQAIADLAARIDAAPFRDDWAFHEPNDYAGILAEQSLDGFSPYGATAAQERSFAEKARSGFLGSVAGCILGKPVEISPTLDELRTALTRIGDWPLDDYISERIHTHGGLRNLHPDAPASVRENIRFVTSDDDINYTLLGMMVLERHGRDFTKPELKRMWLENIPLGYTWGPERGFLAKQALAMGIDDDPGMDLESLPDSMNPGSEQCGAMIRADSYGYVAPGRPDIASALAWRDASMTHRGNGIYGAMFAAAAIAAAFTAEDPLEIFETALRYVPRRSRFYAIVADSLIQVRAADDWLDGYSRIHGRYGQYGHCKVFQESGTLINTLRFANDVGDGICKQVSQGNDTDSYGATAGAILGVYFGPGNLEERWLQPFNDRIETRLAGFYELSLSATADRIAALTQLHAK